MSDAHLNALNALLSAAAAQQNQQLLLLQQQLQQQHQQQQQQQQQQGINPIFQQFQLNQLNMPPSTNNMLTEQALQSFLLAQQQNKNLQQQQQQQQSIINSIDTNSKVNTSMSLDSLPLPLIPTTSISEIDLMKQQQQQQQNNFNKNFFNNSNNNSKNSPTINNDENINHNDDILNEFQKISLNDSKTSNNNSSNNNINSNNNNNNNNNNTSSNFDNSILSMNDSEIYSADQNYMPGTASLIEDVDKLLMVVLRDGKTLIGYLRSIDQYANLLLSRTIERIHVGNKYGDIPRGIYIVRGENVVLIGEVNFNIKPKVEMIKVEVNEILELQRIEQKKLENEKSKKKSLTERCSMPQSDAVLDEYY
jgi:U6 snRNA-associated Sm-like protein LSm1